MQKNNITRCAKKRKQLIIDFIYISITIAAATNVPVKMKSIQVKIVISCAIAFYGFLVKHTFLFRLILEYFADRMS